MKKRTMVAKLVHKITFWGNVKDPTHDQTWREITSSFAEIKPLCDNRFLSLEGMAFGNIITEKYFVFTLRFIKNIDPKMRIKFDNRIFEIKRIIDQDERGRVLTIITLEIDME
jgi:SPP1 family predicted phage head-tail adaptor